MPHHKKHHGVLSHHTVHSGKGAKHTVKLDSVVKGDTHIHAASHKDAAKQISAIVRDTMMEMARRIHAHRNHTKKEQSNAFFNKLKSDLANTKPQAPQTSQSTLQEKLSRLTDVNELSKRLPNFARLSKKMQPEEEDNPQKAYEKGEKQNEENFQRKLNEIQNSRADSDFKKWVAGIGLAGVVDLRNKLFASMINEYQTAPAARAMYGSDIHAEGNGVLVPESIRQRLWTEANEETIPILKATWAAMQSSGSTSGITFTGNLARTVSNSEEGWDMIKGVAVQVGLDWALHLAGGGASDIARTAKKVITAAKPVEELSEVVIKAKALPPKVKTSVPETVEKTTQESTPIAKEGTAAKPSKVKTSVSETVEKTSKESIAKEGTTENITISPADLEKIKEKVQEAAYKAVEIVGEGKGRAYGTSVHTEFKKQILLLKEQGYPVDAEISYLGGEKVVYGRKGSIRADVIIGDIKSPIAVFDLKTGSAKLGAKQMANYKANLPSSVENNIFEMRVDN